MLCMTSYICIPLQSAGVFIFFQDKKWCGMKSRTIFDVLFYFGSYCLSGL